MGSAYPVESNHAYSEKGELMFDHRCPSCNGVIWNGECVPVCLARCIHCDSLIHYKGEYQWEALVELKDLNQDD